MTVLPRFFTDPLSGSSYPTGGQLTSTHENVYVAGMRKIDEAIERQVVSNWPYSHSNATACDTSCACWSTGHEVWLEGRQTAEGSTGPACMYGRQANYFIACGSVSGSDGLTVKGIAAFGTGIVMCGEPSVASAAKYRVNASISTPAWSVGTSGLSTTGAVNAICHHYVASPLVSVYVSGGYDGTVETSPTGVIWTQKVAANANNIVAMESNGVVVVGVTSALSINCVTSIDGDTWVQRTMATTAAWVDVCWATQQSKWVAVGVAGGNIVINTSSDGTTWTATTVLSGLDLTYTPTRILSTGNAIILFSSSLSFFSFDLGATWRQGRYFVDAAIFKAAAVATDPDVVPCQLLYIGSATGADTVYYMSHTGS